jgi:hypothetical protein
MMNLKIKNERPDLERGNKQYSIIDRILEPQLEVFVIQAINTYGDSEKLEEANKLGDVIIQMLKKKNLISEFDHQSFVDVLLAAALTHNLFFDAKAYYAKADVNWEKIFIARRELVSIALELGIPDPVMDALFSTIEAQLGEDMPVISCIAKPNTPTEMFAYACWISKEYIAQD